MSDVGWIKRYFGLDSHDPALFDLVVNTTKLGPADVADLVIEALGKLHKK